MDSKKEKIIKFMNLRIVSFTLSSLFIIIGIIFLVINKGFELGIDFKGGIKIEAEIKDADLKKIRNDLSIYKAEITTINNPSEHLYLITFPVDKVNSTESAQKFIEILKSKYKEIDIRGFDAVDSKIGGNFALRSLNLLIIVLVLIIIYIIIRFDIAYGIGAIIASVHDPLIMLAFCAIFRIPIDITIIAAILTILGYSINDTIVVFDRIREYHNLNKQEDYEIVINKSITSVLVRSIITSLTTLFVAVTIYLFGGIALKNFALLLIVGLIAGTYSSIFIASPITYYMKKIFKN